MTTTARILQSHGLNANIGQAAARELGLTDDTERPAIGTTVGGTKFLGTEDYLSVTVPTPAAIPILRRSNVSIFCDTATAGAHIALDIRNGAQVAGYRVLVFTVGPDNRQTAVQFATGLIDYVPGGASQEYLWTGSAWTKISATYAEKYLIGDMLLLPDKPTISCRAPLVDRSINNDLSSTQYPAYVAHLRAIKCAVSGTTDIAVTVAGSVATFPNTTESNALLTAIRNEATVAHYVNNGEIVNYLGGTDFATAATQQSVNIAGTDYVITAVDLVARTVTVTGSPTTGAQTAIFYPHRIAGSATTARLTKIGGFIPAPIGDAGLELVAGKRKMDRGQGHRHNGFSPAGGGQVRMVTDGAGFGTQQPGSVGDPATDTVNGTPRTGKSTAPLETARNFYDWAGVYIA